jgi:D-amino-acid dehydrogenase
LASGSRAERRAVVIGSGIIGLSVAFFLKRDGWSVTILDPRSPTETTASGSAGLLAVGHVTPVAMPRLLRQLPRTLLDSESPLKLRLAYLPRLAPWMFGFVRAGAASRIGPICDALHALLRDAKDAYRVVLTECAAGDLMRDCGLLVLYRDARSRDAASHELDIKERLGVRFDRIDRANMLRLVPCLAPGVTAGVFYPDYGHCLRPDALLRVIAAELTKRGVEFIHRPASSFEFGAVGVTAVHAAGERFAAELVVLAAGAWSRPFAAMLGARLPLEAERGYHVELKDTGVELGCPVVPSDARFSMTPMANGLRLAGTIEFSGLAAPPDPRRHELMVRQAQRVLRGLRTEQRAHWVGYRPSMPDSLPVIGRAPAAPNVVLSFGHGHIGLTTGPVTGRLIADLAAGRPPAIDLSPFRAERFQETSHPPPSATVEKLRCHL